MTRIIHTYTDNATALLLTPGPCSPRLWADYHARNRPLWRKLLGVK